MPSDYGQLAEEWRRLGEAREQAERLARNYYAHTRGEGVVDVVTGAAAVDERLHRSIRGARRELRRLGEPARSSALEAEHALVDRSVSVRALTASDVPGVLDVPVRMWLVDERFAFVLAASDRALVVYPSQLLTALGLLFEALWERAGAPRRAPAAPDRLVELMLSGLTDEALSRALGVSPRTAQRRVAALMSAAGARTRFQAGVQTALARRREQGSGGPAPRECHAPSSTST